ncbi:MAG TPA: nitrilase-related carbon-nitrogen hydrolase [Gemmatimonadales bacterium]|nr:nitrilase-related carbon-nitrogen hydrolase [Gemmatimonadales bacterium]
MSRLRVALVQMEVTDGDPVRNLTHAERLIDTEPGAGLYLLPELWSSGYVHQQWPAIAQGSTPATLTALKRIATKHRTVIGGTLISLNADGKLVNRFWLVSADGPIAHYDKSHLFAPMQEPAHLTAGTARHRVHLGSWTAAPSICYDLRFPEMYQRDAVDGADLFLVPCEWPAERADAMRALAIARAIETQAFLALTNRTGVAADGTEFGGGSLVAGPGGEVVAAAGAAQGVVLADLDSSCVTESRGAQPHFARRRAGVDW